jgi:hypothetical protein
MYPERDLNPHALRHTPLKRTCIPIPTSGQKRNKYKTKKPFFLRNGFFATSKLQFIFLQLVLQQQRQPEQQHLQLVLRQQQRPEQQRQQPEFLQQQRETC